MKRILLISYNFAPELTGIGKYNGEMVDWFVKKGYDCTVLTGYPYYPDWKVQRSHRRKRFWFSTERRLTGGGNGRLTICRCPFYIPENPSGMKRLMLETTFLISAFIRLIGLAMTKKHDVVIVVAPSFLLGFLGLLYKRIRGAILIYHIQDLQIEAARDLKMIKSKVFLQSMFFLERQILRHADLTSSVSQGMLEKIWAKGACAPILFPNWTNTSQLHPVHDRDELKASFGFSPSDKIVLYSGAIGEKQGLESILYTAMAQQHNAQVKLVICGNGPYKKHLEERAVAMGLCNVSFLPLQPSGRFNYFLNMADVHLVIQKAGAGDLVMPSKLANILAVGGLALITANRGTSLHNLVRKHQVGYLISTDDQEALNNAVEQLLTGDFQYMRTNARNYAVNHLSDEIIMRGFEQELNNLLIRESSSRDFDGDVTEQFEAEVAGPQRARETTNGPVFK